MRADALITGHYVNRIQKNGKAEMYRALDLSRDQSYFLFSTTQEQLKFSKISFRTRLEKKRYTKNSFRIKIKCC